MAEKKAIMHTMIFFSKVNYSNSQAWITQLQTFREQLLHKALPQARCFCHAHMPGSRPRASGCYVDPERSVAWLSRVARPPQATWCPRPPTSTSAVLFFIYIYIYIYLYTKHHMIPVCRWEESESWAPSGTSCITSLLRSMDLLSGKSDTKNH